MYLRKVEEAIQKAGELHKDQRRKGVRELPYVTHLFSVALLVQRYTDDVDVFVAALLHDSIEDTDYTAEQMEKDFGKKVCDIVLGVTEPDEAPTWEDKKRAYIEILRNAREESLLVAAADKVHNMRTMIDDYADDKERFWKEFSGSAEERKEFYGEIVRIIRERTENPIGSVLQNAFNEYREFLTT